jgi:hypothetical protein
MRKSSVNNPTSTVVFLALSPLIVWRIYKRVRRMIGRQRLSAVRPWITVCFFPPIVVLLLLASVSHVNAVASLLAGVIMGSLLGVYGRRLTTFERTPQGLFYTPNAHLGIALSLLFIGRILYRLIELYLVGFVSAAPPNDFGLTPLTLAIFGTLAGYYVTYAFGLLRWRRGVERGLLQDGSAS